MKPESTAYEQTGRTRQKGRTRAALIDAARALLSEGEGLTVEQAADRAGISRTTAYRYFANQRRLLAAVFPALEAPQLHNLGDGASPQERLAVTLAHMHRQILDHEPELRAQLRQSLDPAAHREDLVLRQGRAIAWIEDALAPVAQRLGPAQLRRAACAIRAAAGIEALVWLTDVAGLSREDAVRLMQRSGQALLADALANAPAGAPSARSSPRRD